MEEKTVKYDFIVNGSCSCALCGHDPVCSYQTVFEQAKVAIDKTVTMDTVNHILKPIAVECKHYIAK